MKQKNMSGLNFGRLMVIDEAPRSKNNDIMWNCICECGNSIVASGKLLRNGHIQSCGCLWREKFVMCGTKPFNQYKKIEDYIVIYGDSIDEVAFIDEEDLDIVQQYHWYKDKSKGYWTTNIIQEDGRKTTLTLHRLVTNANSNEIVDHINRDKNNNRKSNLRKCTSQQNSYNHSLKINNKTGYSGVALSRNRKRWTANIRINGKRKFLGTFDTKEEAIQARLQAEADWYGEYAPQAYLFEEYHIKVKKPIMEDF